MGKIKETRQLYKTTLKEISSSPSNWRTFLDSSAWNFKYDFESASDYIEKYKEFLSTDYKSFNKYDIYAKLILNEV